MLVQSNEAEDDECWMGSFLLKKRHQADGVTYLCYAQCLKANRVL